MEGSRVWETVLACWSLPGLVTDQAPVCLIDRESCLSVSEPFLSLTAPAMDPLDYGGLQEVAQQNSRLVGEWSADVFLSSWITSFIAAATPLLGNVFGARLHSGTQLHNHS